MPKHDKLIIDVGMHDGEDTAYYLHRGFEVAAIEADPQMVEQCQARFAKEIEDGRLRIFPVAIAEQEGTLRLGVTDDTGWNSASPEVIARNEGAGAEYHFVEVPAVTFASILDDVGTPHFLKIDIEGADMLCVKALADVPHDERPTYVSIESEVTQASATAENVFDELAWLWTLGYRSFKYVNQRVLPQQQHAGFQFTEYSSGPFGEDTPGPWRGIGAIQKQAELLRVKHELTGFGGRWDHTRPSKLYRRVARKLGRPYPWFDLHAKLGE